MRRAWRGAAGSTRLEVRHTVRSLPIRRQRGIRAALRHGCGIAFSPQREEIARSRSLQREALEAKRVTHGDRHASILASIGNMAKLLEA